MNDPNECGKQPLMAFNQLLHTFKFRTIANHNPHRTTKTALGGIVCPSLTVVQQN